MKLTLGELSVITETLSASLAFVNWKGFDSKTREAILHKLWNDPSLIFNITTVEDSESKEEK